MRLIESANACGALATIVLVAATIYGACSWQWDFAKTGGGYFLVMLAFLVPMNIVEFREFCRREKELAEREAAACRDASRAS